MPKRDDIIKALNCKLSMTPQKCTTECKYSTPITCIPPNLVNQPIFDIPRIRCDEKRLYEDISYYISDLEFKNDMFKIDIIRFAAHIEEGKKDKLESEISNLAFKIELEDGLLP